jgi:type II secretion system protein C
MARYLSWLLNGALLAVCCFFTARTANAVLAAWLAPPAGPVPSEAPAAHPEGVVSNHQVILDRNLFHSAIAIAALNAEELREELEETKLPLGLLGTVASPNPQLSWAAVEDRNARTHLVLRVGGTVMGQATVERIERKRIVLRENGRLRELTLEQDNTTVAAAPPAPARRAAAARRRVARPPRPAPPPPVAVEPLDTPPELSTAQLFSQAQILPKYENGAMQGVQVSAIQAGSLFQNLGFADGDVITASNGQPLDSPESAAKLLTDLGGDQPISLSAIDANGVPKTITVDPSQLREPAQPAQE